MSLPHVLPDNGHGARGLEILKGDRIPGRLDPKELRPTLLIGIGGTGHDIVNSYKQMLNEMTDDNPPRWVRLLVLDTATETPKGGDIVTEDEKLYIVPPSKEEYLEYKKNRRATDLGEWIPEDDSTIRSLLVAGGEAKVEGASGKRQLGRICLYHCMTKVEHRVKAEIEYVLATARDLGSGSSADIVVVASAGGGTGTGCLIDLLFVVRHLVRQVKTENRWDDLNVFQRCGLVIGDALFTRVGKATEAGCRQFWSNTYALLKEMNAFLSEHKAFEARYPGALHIESHPDVETREEDKILVNDVFLFERDREVDGWESPDSPRAESWNDFVAQIALGLFHLGYGQISSDYHARYLGNPGGRDVGIWSYQQGNDLERKQRRKFSAFGVVEVHLPAQDIMDCISERVSERVARSMCKERDLSPDEAWGMCARIIEQVGTRRGSTVRDLMTGAARELPAAAQSVALARIVVTDVWRVLNVEKLRKDSEGKPLPALFENYSRNLGERWPQEITAEATKAGLISSVDEDGRIVEQGSLYRFLNEHIREVGLGETVAAVSALQQVVRTGMHQLEELRDSGEHITLLRSADYRADERLREPREPDRNFFQGLFNLASAEQEKWRRKHREARRRIETAAAAWCSYCTDVSALSFLADVSRELQRFEDLELTDLQSVVSSVGDRLEARHRRRCIDGIQPFEHRRIRGLDADDVRRIEEKLLDPGRIDGLTEEMRKRIQEDSRFPLDDPRGVPYEDLLQEHQEGRLSMDELKSFLEEQIVRKVRAELFGNRVGQDDELDGRVREAVVERLQRDQELMGEEIDVGNPRLLEILDPNDADELYDRIAGDLKYSIPPVHLRSRHGQTGIDNWDRQVWFLGRTNYRIKPRVQDFSDNVEELWRGDRKKTLSGQMGENPTEIEVRLGETASGMLQMRMAVCFPLFMLRNLENYEKKYLKLSPKEKAYCHLRAEYVDLPNLTMDSPTWFGDR